MLCSSPVLEYKFHPPLGKPPHWVSISPFLSRSRPCRSQTESSRNPREETSRKRRRSSRRRWSGRRRGDAGISRTPAWSGPTPVHHGRNRASLLLDPGLLSAPRPHAYPYDLPCICMVLRFLICPWDLAFEVSVFLLLAGLVFDLIVHQFFSPEERSFHVDVVFALSSLLSDFTIYCLNFWFIFTVSFLFY